MEKERTIIVPMIPLRGMTVFPNMTVSFPAGRQKSLDALVAAEDNRRQVFLICQKDTEVKDPKQEDLYEIGTLAEVKQVLKLPGNITHVIVEGLERGRLEAIRPKEDCDYARITTLAQDDDMEPDNYILAMMRLAGEKYEQYLKFAPGGVAVDLLGTVVSAKKPGRMADAVGAGMEIYFDRKQRLLEEIQPFERLQLVMEELEREMGILDVKKEIESKTRAKIEQNQREYYLREEMKIIQEELGDKDGIGAEAAAFRLRMTEKNPPEMVRLALEKEIDRMIKIPITSPESNVSRNYIETLLSLPWNETTKERFDLKKAEAILNEDHYGLEKVKERMLEYLAVRQNAPDQKPTILCLVGPPGVGKTSIARSVAKALNRKYVRMSLGGVKDEAEIRGHRKTYIGAMPGRIINAMKQVGTVNPLMLLDEVDKLGVSHNGDPSAALLEVLDGEQNGTFRDHFVELPYDLSKVLFMCTANSTDTIPRPLLDRMEIISLGSYTATEKLHIAMNHLLPKQRERHGLQAGQIRIKPEVCAMLIDGYTREAGVRQLERVVGQVCRKAVKEMMGGQKKSISVTEKNLEELLGQRKFTADAIYKEDQVGIVRGLAWTAVGGTTLSIEVNVMEGDGKFKLTGNVGKVMTESAEAAMSYIRSEREAFGLDGDFYKKQDIHIHIPQGATPKDGPSAGITMTCAILSALKGAKIRHDVAMTGEVTIRGRVLPIGGLEEKVLAAKKVGITTVVFPYENEKDLAEVKAEIKEGMEFVPAKTMQDVLQVALAEGESVWK